MQVATSIATRMVCEWGYEPSIMFLCPCFCGFRIFEGGGSQRVAQSDDTSCIIYVEINKIIENCLQEAMIIFQGKEVTLHSLAKHLLEKVTMDGDEVNEVLAGVV